MPYLHLTIFIAAPAQRVFDLSRHAGLHKESMQDYKEEAVAGTTSGLIEKNETVTWKANHLWKTRTLQIKITQLEKYYLFVDEQVAGDFKTMRHEHHFKPCENGTIMIDVFTFESPYGFIGRLLNATYLTRYMKKILEQRNKFIKEFAEGDKWKMLLEK